MTQRFRSAIRTGYRAGLDLVLPPACSYCFSDMPSAAEVQLCDRCQDEFLNSEASVCLKCGCPLPKSFDEDQPQCANCRDLGFRFCEVIALGDYRGELRRAILQMKPVGGYTLSVALGQLLVQERRRRLAEFAADAVAAIPMHWTRRLWRGTNSAETISECLARHLDAAWGPRLLVRARNTRRQADLAPGKRTDNLRGALRIASGFDIAGLRVLVVDDVLTTGATCNEAARVLLAGGAAEVAVAVVARAIPWK